MENNSHFSPDVLQWLSTRQVSIFPGLISVLITVKLWVFKSCLVLTFSKAKLGGKKAKEKTPEASMVFMHSLFFFTWIHGPNPANYLYGHLFILQNPTSAAAVENVTENRAGLRPAKLIFHVIFHSDEIIFYYQANTRIKISPSFRGAMTDTFLPSALKEQSCSYSNQVPRGLFFFLVFFSYHSLDFRGKTLILPLHTKIEELPNLINRILLKSKVRF